MRLPESVVAWTPLPDSHPRYLNSVKDAREVIGAVAWGIGLKSFDSDLYFLLLAERVQSLINEEPDQEAAAQDMWDQLHSVGLVSDSEQQPTSPHEAGELLVYQNRTLRDYLSLLNLPGKLPKVLPPDNPKARALIETTNLQRWLSVLSARPTESNR